MKKKQNICGSIKAKWIDSRKFTSPTQINPMKDWPWQFTVTTKRYQPRPERREEKKDSKKLNLPYYSTSFFFWQWPLVRIWFTSPLHQRIISGTKVLLDHQYYQPFAIDRTFLSTKHEDRTHEAPSVTEPKPHFTSSSLIKPGLSKIKRQMISK